MKAIPRTKNKKIYISLPYANGILQKVLLEGEEIESDALGVGEFFIFLPDSMNPNAGNKLEVIWQFPIQNMVVEKENGTCAYRTRARSLIPVDQFNLTAILDDNSGFEVIGKPNQKRWPAIWNMVPRYLTGNFGSCGFHIRKINEEECP